MMPHNLPYYSQLVLARAALETGIEDYPDDSCVDAAVLVSLLCPQLEILSGTYTPSFTGIPRAQTWNYDLQRGIYVNIALDEFQEESIEKIPKITVQDANDPRFKEDPLHTKAVNNWKTRLHKEYEDFRGTLSLIGLNPIRV